MTWKEIDNQLEAMGLDINQKIEIRDLINEFCNDIVDKQYWRDWDFGG